MCDIQVKNYFAFHPSQRTSHSQLMTSTTQPHPNSASDSVFAVCLCVLAVATVRLPTPSFVYAFQTAVREWLRTAPVAALLTDSTYSIPAGPAEQAEDAAFTAAQVEARAQPPVEYAFAVPLGGVPPVVKTGTSA
jgi:hypothetical protein